jgi:hypothetical protein
LWQRNLAAILVERFVYWKPRHAEAVAVLTGLQVA